MSKKLIAGLGTVAALGIAALPLTGVLAVTDTTVVRVRVTTSVECTSAGTDTDFVWLGEIAPGTTGTGAFTVSGSTNDPDGFAISGEPTALVSGTLAAGLTESTDRGETTDFTPNSVDSIAYTATANTEDSWWIEAQSGTSATIDANGVSVTGAVGAVRTYAFNAKVLPGLGTEPGLYQGTITWTCTAQ
ncbi:hypothetical protein IKX64_01365 [Candidatus Saccharibacteria bacterium]|nr:hypothetical protein [Candidatus Saccharibacteria bacterium]